MLRYATQCHVILCYIMLQYATLHYVMLRYGMLCYVMLRYATLCYVMLCYAMLCYAMLCKFVSLTKLDHPFDFLCESAVCPLIVTYNAIITNACSAMGVASNVLDILHIRLSCWVISFTWVPTTWCFVELHLMGWCCLATWTFDIF